MNKIKHTMEDLAEAGVEFSMDEANKFMQLIQEFVNNSHLYINRGWTPSELAEYGRKMYPNQKPVITLGPGARKAIENGEFLQSSALRLGIRFLPLKFPISENRTIPAF